LKLKLKLFQVWRAQTAKTQIMFLRLFSI